MARCYLQQAGAPVFTLARGAAYDMNKQLVVTIGRRVFSIIDLQDGMAEVARVKTRSDKLDRVKVLGRHSSRWSALAWLMEHGAGKEVI